MCTGRVKNSPGPVWSPSKALSARPASRFAFVRPHRPTPIRSLHTGAHDGRSGLRRHHDRGLRTGGPHRTGGDEAVTAENTAGLVVAVSLLVHLVLALVHPERF
ncbi:potassium-transporting ATPase subunit F [Streptomyces sp.]|uniref:potassium-transporting ATPase subunit F n=1 Tax=Streptomyces sp. TaxID=1931 RepID=UPI0039C9A20F